MTRRDVSIGMIAAAIVVIAAALAWLASDRRPDRPLRVAGVPCRPEPGFTPSPMPDPQQGPLVSHVERTRVATPIAIDLAYVARLSLEKTIQKSDLPHVVGTYDLTQAPFGTPGSQRLTCLSDGSSLVEQVLLARRTATTDRFRYIVWDYSSPQARPVDHAIGDFVRTAVGPGATDVTWTYSFALRDNRVPGAFGPLGRYAFQRFFLDRSYAEMMRNTLAAEKAGAEASARYHKVAP